MLGGGPVRVAAWRDVDGTALYGPAAVAAALGVVPAAVSNWTARGGGPLGPPHAVARRPSRDVPLWTAAQVNAAVAAERAAITARLAEVERRAEKYRRRLERMRPLE